MAILLLGTVCARAAESVTALSVQARALTLEFLKRWGYDADKVMALPPQRKAELQKEISALETSRLRRLKLLRKIVPEQWRGYVTEDEMLTPEGLKLVDDYLAKMGAVPLPIPAQAKNLQNLHGKPPTAEEFAEPTTCSVTCSTA